jgi:hypothetical protein
MHRANMVAATGQSHLNLRERLGTQQQPLRGQEAARMKVHRGPSDFTDTFDLDNDTWAELAVLDPITDFETTHGCEHASIPAVSFPSRSEPFLR